MIHPISSIVFLAVLPSVHLSTLQGLMEREVEFQSQIEIFAGRFYLRFPDYLFLSIHSPLRQIIISRGDTTLVHFPDIGKGFRSVGRNPFDSELAGNLFQAQAQWDLTNVGYTLSGEESQGDTLLRHWLPGEGAIIGKVIVREVKGRVVAIEVFGRDGHKVAETKYLRFLKSGESSIPTRIVSFSLTNNDTVYERISYRKLKVNEEIPDSVLNYKLPEDVKILEE